MALIDRWATVALKAAHQGIAEALAAVAPEHHVQGVGIAAEVRDRPALAIVLRSHPLLHSAEGQLSREMLAEAAAAVGLPVLYLSPKGPIDPADRARAERLRDVAGTPWRREHKLAATAGIMTLRVLEDHPSRTTSTILNTDRASRRKP